MFVSLLRYLQGYLKIRVTGYSPERFLNLCKNKKIDVWGLESAYNAYVMYIKISGFRKLKPILKKTRTKVAIEERMGLPFFFYRYRKRKLFFLGSILCLLFIYSMTFFIWNIDLEGNQTITDDVMMEFLESKHISHGIPKFNVNCEQISKEIRKEFDDIIWVSASLEGTKLFIHVKENMDTYEENKVIEEPCDLVAKKDGIIVRIITRSGVPQVKVGDIVKAGDVLVSGTVDVLNDAKEVVSQKFVTADADILLETTVHYEEKVNHMYKKKTYTKKNRKIPFIKIGSFTLHFGWQKIAYRNYDLNTTETQLKIGENFYLPFFYGYKSYSEYKWESFEYGEEELENLLKKNFEVYCENLVENQIIILENVLSISKETKATKATSILILQEEGGIPRKIVDF